MKLYIAEKPSLGRAIANALPKPHKKAEGCIYVANGDCVSWCIGHLLEQAEPDAYDPSFKTWQFEHLPIIPQQWQLTPKTSVKKQFTILSKLIKQADELVHAGDPDREGQLLVDQVINYVKGKDRNGNKTRTKTKTKTKTKNKTSKYDSIQRCLINDLNPSAVKRSLLQLQTNKAFAALSISALARSRADWLYGINMTRAYTIQGRKSGYKGVLSVGRVQTPLLGLVVRRDQDIDNFTSKPFYQVLAYLSNKKTDDHNSSDNFIAKWIPSEACRPYQDEEGRILSKHLAENVIARIKHQRAEVISTKRKIKKQVPPLPYNLSALQIDAAKRFGLSAKQVLDHCQSLYERHKLLTYPRSDCRYLPQQHFTQATAIIETIAHNSANNDTHSKDLRKAAANANKQLKSKAWNDSKISAHHAIIPTEKKLNLEKLNTAERNIYQLVARQYLAQFYPVHEYQDSEITLHITGGLFIAKAKETTKQGWKILFHGSKGSSKEKSVNKKDEALNQQLPTVKKGDILHCDKGELLEKKTTPPKAFDDASLLLAMTGIARHVADKQLREILKDTDGLGTEATRAGIIELLFKRNFLQRRGKKIHATSAGKGLIASLPATATTPDMTARWEMQLDAISQRQENYQDFIQPLSSNLKAMIVQSQNK